MQQYKEILNYLKSSKKALLTYSFSNERKKDEFLSNLDYIRYDSVQSILRNHKINQIINQDNSINEWVVVDINDCFTDKTYSGSIAVQRSKIIKSLFLSIENITNQKIILTSPTYFSGNKKHVYDGNALLYQADFVFNIDDKITIIKNRFGPDSYKIGL